MPEISGTPAGYITLIVFFSLIILFSCVGIFILLREHEPDSDEREARRALSGKPDELLYQMPLGPPGLKERVRNLFRFNRKRGGWVRASAGDAADAWDASDHRAAYDPPNARGEPWKSDGASAYAKCGARDPKVRKSDTLESIQLSPPSPHAESSTLDGVTLPALSYSHPRAASPTPMETSERSIYDPTSHAGGGIEPSPPSVPQYTPMRTFENGTRFKESL